MLVASKSLHGEGVIVEGQRPKLTRLQVERSRELAIARAFYRGNDPQQIAWFFRCHRATVYRIVQRVPMEAVETDGPTLTLG